MQRCTFISELLDIIYLDDLSRESKQVAQLGIGQHKFLGTH